MIRLVDQFDNIIRFITAEPSTKMRTIQNEINQTLGFMRYDLHFVFKYGNVLVNNMDKRLDALGIHPNDESVKMMVLVVEPTRNEAMVTVQIFSVLRNKRYTTNNTRHTNNQTKATGTVQRAKRLDVGRANA